MTEYADNLKHITEEMLTGFFVGWPNPPLPASHMKILKGSYAVWLAVDADLKKTVGFINAVSDGILSAYIPLLEVLPDYRNVGIGSELVSRMLETLKNFYMVDLICDEEMRGFYKRFGMGSAVGLALRNYERQNCG